MDNTNILAEFSMSRRQDLCNYVDNSRRGKIKKLPATLEKIGNYLNISALF